MKRARFTEEHIIGVLREHEAGAKTADLARTIYSNKGCTLKCLQHGAKSLIVIREMVLPDRIEL
ncbi:hypothetical protein [Bradyrhizobium cosmicum]|uniref:hypothetical protein n=1 Tax=Bradyrhizobium cosmicum TaxID=1404864 RepID=UPI0028F04568|nr:hypothetical protein [Bradyrhizobium cosmicum]